MPDTPIPCRIDNGYTKLCVKCVKTTAFDFKPHLIGKEREVSLGICPKCLEKKRRVANNFWSRLERDYEQSG